MIFAVLDVSLIMGLNIGETDSFFILIFAVFVEKLYTKFGHYFTVCFNVCCNPAFLAAKSNRGYYYNITRTAKIKCFTVACWRPAHPSVYKL